MKTAHIHLGVLCYSSELDLNTRKKLKIVTPVAPWGHCFNFGSNFMEL